ncbi:hypothetical protein [Ferroplasma sp.]|jgi:hypothetical protein|nr:hypothetical protein [Ferroplasma sp.]
MFGLYSREAEKNLNDLSLSIIGYDFVSNRTGGIVHMLLLQFHWVV